jgi:hypothetical protein
MVTWDISTVFQPTRHPIIANPSFAKIYAKLQQQAAFSTRVFSSKAQETS